MFDLGARVGIRGCRSFDLSPARLGSRVDDVHALSACLINMSPYAASSGRGRRRRSSWVDFYRLETWGTARLAKSLILPFRIQRIPALPLGFGSAGVLSSGAGFGLPPVVSGFFAGAAGVAF